MPPVPPEADSGNPKNEKSSANGNGSVLALTPTTVQVDDKIYNAESLSQIHPGGELFIKVFAGRDATEAFLSYHRRTFPHQKMAEHLVGKGAMNRYSAAAQDEEYLALCAEVEKVLPRHASFAPISYYVKLAGLLTLTLGLEYHIHSQAVYPIHLTALQGLLFALVGMNIQHDANHGAISRVAVVNRVLGLTQNWIGGSALDWIHQHVVQHHIAPNDCEQDPDIVGNSLLRLNPLKPLLAHQRFQHLYVFLLILLFGASYVCFSIVHVLQGFHFTKMSALVDATRRAESWGFVLFHLRWLLLPVLRTGSLGVLLRVLPMFVSGGYYLAFFFLISHNFEGVYFEERGAATTKIATAGDATGTDAAQQQEGMGFLRRQVATAGNVGGVGLCFLNGGLNYQIEHHLFPRVQHTHYPLIAPVVRRFCEQRGIPYVHFPTVRENLASCVRHLSVLGHQKTPSNFHSSHVVGGKNKTQ